MIVFDTNVLSEFMKPRPDGHVVDWLAAVNDATLATTAVTLAEIEFGLQRLPQGRRQSEMLAQFESQIAVLQILVLDDAAARLAGRFMAQRQAQGAPADPSDMMIAGMAALAGATLATRNTRDFLGLPVSLVDPWRVS